MQGAIYVLPVPNGLLAVHARMVLHLVGSQLICHAKRILCFYCCMEYKVMLSVFNENSDPDTGLTCDGESRDSNMERRKEREREKGELATVRNNTHFTQQ